MRVEFSRFVEGDLDTIASYIAQDNAARAVSFIQEIRAKILAVGRDPLLYQLRPEIGEGARLAVAGRYVILFRTYGEVVRIERVLFGGRDLPGLFTPEQWDFAISNQGGALWTERLLRAKPRSLIGFSTMH